MYFEEKTKKVMMRWGQRKGGMGLYSESIMERGERKKEMGGMDDGDVWVRMELGWEGPFHRRFVFF